MSDIASAARTHAQHAAARSGVEIRTLTTDQMRPAAALLESIWASSPIEPPLLVALAHSGAYVAGAFEGDRIVGACVGYFAEPLGTTLHSHVAGVDPTASRRGVGLALKLHQRAWALAKGLSRITWTFDPLVARNAAFNTTLGVGFSEYLVDFYGDMTDGVNAGQGSDRVMVSWDLSLPVPAPPPQHLEIPSTADAVLEPAPLLTVGADMAPVTRPLPSDAETAMVAIPSDIESLRRSRPALGSAWRLAVREALTGAMHTDWQITGFADGHYLLRRST